MCLTHVYTEELYEFSAQPTISLHTCTSFSQCADSIHRNKSCIHFYSWQWTRCQTDVIVELSVRGSSLRLLSTQGLGSLLKKKPTFSYSDNKTSLHQKDIKNVCTSLIKLDKQIINFLWSFKHQAIFIFMWLHTYHLGGGALNYRSFFLNKTELVSNIKQLFIGTILYTTTLFKFSPTE